MPKWIKYRLTKLNFEMPKKIYINCILKCILMKRYKYFFSVACFFVQFGMHLISSTTSYSIDYFCKYKYMYVHVEKDNKKNKFKEKQMNKKLKVHV